MEPASTHLLAGGTLVAVAVVLALIVEVLSSRRRGEEVARRLVQEIGLLRYTLREPAAAANGARAVATIAVFNEERNLPAVLARMPPGVDVIVIDDGSTDGSAEVARRHGARVLRHSMNLGQGAAVVTGLRTALLDDYDVIVEMDGDGQHDPAEIPLFVAELESTDVDIVVGSRLAGSNYHGAPLPRRLLLPVVTALVNRITGFSLTDSMCGFRAFRTSSLRRAEPLLERFREPQYLAVEMFIRFAREGFEVSEVPIRLNRRSFGTSHKGFFRYGWGIVLVILRDLLRSER